MDGLELILKRMAIGRKRYGHGVRPLDDTTQWGTRENSWLEMTQEEVIDAIIYTCADYIRKEKIKYDEDANELILRFILNPGLMKTKFHTTLLKSLQEILKVIV